MWPDGHPELPDPSLLHRVWSAFLCLCFYHTNRQIRSLSRRAVAVGFEGVRPCAVPCPADHLCIPHRQDIREPLCCFCLCPQRPLPRERGIYRGSIFVCFFLSIGNSFLSFLARPSSSTSSAATIPAASPSASCRHTSVLLRNVCICSCCSLSSSFRWQRTWQGSVHGPRRFFQHQHSRAGQTRNRKPA